MPADFGIPEDDLKEEEKKRPEAYDDDGNVIEGEVEDIEPDEQETEQGGDKIVAIKEATSLEDLKTNDGPNVFLDKAKRYVTHMGPEVLVLAKIDKPSKTVYLAIQSIPYIP